MRNVNTRIIASIRSRSCRNCLKGYPAYEREEALLMKDDRLWDEYYENNGVHAINMEKVKDMLRKHDLIDPRLRSWISAAGTAVFSRD